MEEDPQQAGALDCIGVVGGHPGQGKVGEYDPDADGKKLVWLHLLGYRNEDEDQAKHYQHHIAPTEVGQSYLAQVVLYV